MLSYYEEFIDLLPDEVKNSDDFQKLIKIFFELLEESADLSVNTTQVKLVDSLFEKFSKTKEGIERNLRPKEFIVYLLYKSRNQ